MSLADMDTTLIELVRSHPELYEPSHPGYYDFIRKDNAWKQISECFDSGTDCRKRWLQLRDSFRKCYQKRRKAPSGKSNKKHRPWKYENAMGFIIPYMEERKPFTGVDPESDDSNNSVKQQQSLDGDKLDESQDAQIMDEMTENLEFQGTRQLDSTAPGTSTVRFVSSKEHDKSKQQSLNLPTATQQYKEYIYKKNSTRNEVSRRSANDEILSSFFTAMEKTVRTFPIPMQIEVKGKISGLINEYELKNYVNQTRTLDSSRDLLQIQTLPDPNPDSSLPNNFLFYPCNVKQSPGSEHSCNSSEANIQDSSQTHSLT